MFYFKLHSPEESQVLGFFFLFLFPCRLYQFGRQNTCFFPGEKNVLLLILLVAVGWISMQITPLTSSIEFLNEICINSSEHEP